jgi:hypothetical protein
MTPARYVLAVLAVGVFVLAPVGGAAGDGAASFTDPLEHAFTLDVPAGWIVRGGMFRLGYSDYRPMVDLESRDGRSSVRLGDVAVPSYAVPTPQHSEGDRDDLGAQAQLVYARYRTGKEYVALYALTRFKKLCRRLTPERSAWTPPAQGPGSASSVAYRCDAPGGARTAYAYARTQQASPVLWQVVSLCSFLAPATNVASVESVIARAANSLKLDAGWIAKQKQLDAQGLQYQIARQRSRRAALGQQVAQFESRMRGMQNQVDAFERGQQMRQTQFQQFDNAITGLTPAVDPLSGAQRDVWTGPGNGYWVNGSGTIVNSSTSPGSAYHQLNTQ